MEYIGGRKKRKTKSKRKRTHSKKRKTHRRSRSSSCPPGMIRRKGYTRRSKSGKRTRTLSTCIKDQGYPGKGKKIFTLKKGELTQFGYETFASPESRHRALKKSVEAVGYKPTVLRLNALRVLEKNRPFLHKRYTDDMKWVQDHMGNFALRKFY